MNSKKSIVRRDLDSVFGEWRKFLEPVTVGFDTLFDDLYGLAGRTAGYPPYNITQEGGSIIVEVALAGWKKEDILVQVEDSVLTVQSKEQEAKEESTTVLYKGIAKRSFTLKFRLAEAHEVTYAAMSEGMLRVEVSPKVVTPTVNYIEIQ
jgi:molecular chaperone IbpA